MAQLYRLLTNVELPSGASPLTRTRQHYITYTKHTSLPLMFWPNGTPCHLVNLWLMDIAKATTGKESTKTSAALITHFVRFCFSRDISFYDFNDSYFTIFTNDLKNELKTKKSEIDSSARTRTQVLSIQHTCLKFLLWIQKIHPAYEQLPLIGLALDQPRIVIEWRYTPYRNSPYIWHPELVQPTAPLNDKFPMPEKHIAKLRSAVYARYQNTLKMPGRSQSPHAMATIKYLYSRRMFTINMMTNFGLRPEELQEMSVEENSNIVFTLTVILPTKKTRTPQASRRLKINMGLAVSLQTYFDDRAEFIKHLNEHGYTSSQASQMLLGKNGQPLEKPSLTKEFDRLCEDAGLNNRKVCLSMFRHRFISREVKAELLLRFKNNPELMGELTPALRDTVAREVITKTGHRDPKSIWTYVDEQYKLLTTPDSHESFQSIKNDIEQTKNTLEDLLFRQNFNSQEQMSDELKILRKYIQGLEERLYAAERKISDD